VLVLLLPCMCFEIMDCSGAHVLDALVFLVIGLDGIYSPSIPYV